MQTFDEILEALPLFTKTAKGLKEVLLANLAMVGEIPAPTFGEQERVDFLINRFKEANLHKQWVDEAGNAVGVLEGSEDKKNILVVAHVDTVFPKDVDHTMRIEPNHAAGPGAADNSLGLAVLATLPLLLEKLNIELENNLVLVGATKSLGRGNLKGLRSFLSSFNHPIKAGVSLEGIQLGRLSHTSIGMLRGEITCHIPDTYDWTRFGDASAVLTVNELINHINEIEIPQRPRSRIVLGSIRAGSSFSTARWGTLRFEIRSESSEMVKKLDQRLHEIIKKVSTESAESVELDVFAERQPGGIEFTHSLVRKTHRILEALDIESHPGPSTSELSTFIDRKIPAITLGISNGSNVRNESESVEIEPIFTGIAQILGTIQAIDRGFCEED